MENTSCGDNCAYVKSGFCNSDCECPHYVESFWENRDGKIKLIKDCAPKRFLLEQQQSINRTLGCQSAIEQLRDKVENLESLLLQIIGKSKKVLGKIEHEKNNGIDYDR